MGERLNRESTLGIDQDDYWGGYSTFSTSESVIYFFFPVRLPIKQTNLKMFNLALIQHPLAQRPAHNTI